MKNDLELHQRVILSVCRAMLGEVFQALRSVQVSEDEDCKKICIFFVCERALELNEIESVDSIEAEVLGDFYNEYAILSKVVISALPERPNLGWSVYWRRERIGE